MQKDTAFELATSNIRFGPGITREIGMDLSDSGVGHVMVLTDPILAQLPPVATVLQSLSDEKLSFILYDRVRVEPSDESFKDAIDFAKSGNFDGFVAVGGGSTIDTAKAANLYSTYPAEFLDYVNPPIGRGLPVPGQVKPLTDNRRYRQRDDRRGHLRSGRDARQDRHCSPTIETHPGSG